MSKLTRCDNCKREIKDSRYQTLYHVEKAGVVLVSDQTEWDFCTPICIAEYFGGKVSED